MVIFFFSFITTCIVLLLSWFVFLFCTFRLIFGARPENKLETNVSFALVVILCLAGAYLLNFYLSFLTK